MTVEATVGTLRDEEDPRRALPATRAEALRELIRLETILYVSFVNRVGDGPDVAANAIQAQLARLDDRSPHGYVLVYRSDPAASGPFGTRNDAILLTITLTVVDQADWERYVEILMLYRLSVEWRRDRQESGPA